MFSRGVHEALLVRIPDGWSPLNKYAHAFFFLMFFRDALYLSLTRLRTRVGRKPCLLRGRVRPHRSYLQAFHGARPNLIHVVLTIPTPPISQVSGEHDDDGMDESPETAAAERKKGEMSSLRKKREHRQPARAPLSSLPPLPFHPERPKCQNPHITPEHQLPKAPRVSTSSPPLR